MDTKMIGGKIAEARRKINHSQAQLAESLFISPQAVGKWERGESLPDIITLNRLAQILGVDLNYFSDSFQSVMNEKSLALDLPDLQPPESQAGKQKNRMSRDMSKSNWVDADFSGLKNLHEKFSSSNMQRCKFIESELSGILLRNNNVGGCDFSGSGFINSCIQRSNLSRNIFKACSLKDAEFTESYFSGCDFSGADFSGSLSKSGGFEKCTMENAILNNTSFHETYLADIVFNGALENCSFEDCTFTRVKFQEARLINCFFKNNKNLKKVKFIDCQADRITYAFLKSGNADVSSISLI